MNAFLFYRSGFRTVGDVEFESAAKRASLITPVPGEFLVPGQISGT